MQNEQLVDLKETGLSEEELFAHYDNNLYESEQVTAPRYSYWKSVFRVFFKKKLNIVFLVFLAIVIIFAYIYPLITGYFFNAEVMYNMNAADNTAKHLLPADAIQKFGFSLRWILGTGDVGQSTFDALWYGSSISVSLAFMCAIINMAIGILLGAIWGFSKKVDIVMTEVYNVIGNIPYTLIIMVFVQILSPSFWTMVFALTVTGWLAIAYFIRTQVIVIRDREYNLASRCLGTGIFRLTIKNILPFMTSVIVTLAAAEIPSYISYEVYLSYIGLGISDMTLGRIIQQTQSFMAVPQWGFEYWSPIIMSSIITIILYVVGQNLGDASDPKTHM
ncbi:MAG: ABC transporter permease [Clostridia bacterium]|nr:ABC transporter permease [Clostridia bacterium]